MKVVTITGEPLARSRVPDVAMVEIMAEYTERVENGDAAGLIIVLLDHDGFETHGMVCNKAMTMLGAVDLMRADLVDELRKAAQ